MAWRPGKPAPDADRQASVALAVLGDVAAHQAPRLLGDALRLAPRAAVGAGVGLGAQARRLVGDVMLDAGAVGIPLGRADVPGPARRHSLALIWRSGG